MKAILGSYYAGNILYFSKLREASEVLIDLHEHYEKQTYRNRTEIYGANGLLKLIIPLERKGNRTAMKNVKIDNDQRWQKLHWRSIESAYRSSPYFEFYEHHFQPFFEKEFNYLTDFNQAILEKCLALLQIDTTIRYTEKYERSYEGFEDFRTAISPKVKLTDQIPSESYMQVFDEKCGFISNLSILDLLFNEGPNSVSYL